GSSYTVPFDPAQATHDPLPGSRPGGPPKGAEDGADPAAGLVFTGVTIEIEEVIHGDSLKPGERVTLALLGGQRADGNPVVVEHDPLPQVGDREVVFLQRDPASGNFFATGGGQGRFRLTGRDQLQAIDGEHQVGRAS